MAMAVSAQNQKKVLTHHVFSFEIVPGLGTSGFNPGAVTSNFSFNIFSGYKFWNKGISLSGISSMHVVETRGFQISGIANMTGLNFELSPFITPEDEADMNGLQLAGVYNYVRDYIHGAQISGLYNRGRNLFGLQVSAINRISGFGFGAQLGILYNWSAGSFDGAQLGILVNETNNRLVGLQLASLNLAKLIEGKNSDQGGKLTGFQIGLINYSGEMHGFQIGLINIAGKMRGTQFGLVNIGSARNTPVGIRGGTMIGLFNGGVFHSVGVRTSELFLYNISLETGTHKNAQMLGETTHRYLTSRIEYGFSPTLSDGYKRQFGVSIHKYYYNRTLTPGMNQRRFVNGSLGLRYLQLSGEKFDVDNVYGTVGIEGGYQPFKKIGVYVTAQIELNYAWNGLGTSNLPHSSFDAGSGIMWPGWRLGLQVH